MASLIEFLLKKIIGNNNSDHFEIMSDEILLKKLKILSKIPEHGRLCVYADDTISLEPETRYQSIKRTITGDNRDKTIKIIKTIIKQASNQSTVYMDHKYMDIYLVKDATTLTESAVHEHNNLIDKLNMLKKEMYSSKKGIHNLKDTTYKDDASIVSELELILHEIESKIEEIESKVNRVHNRYVFKESALEKNVDSAVKESVPVSDNTQEILDQEINF